ncbi:MAG: hypothetical protein JWO67_6 [Streptosporangiaceae bacterium]|nr:hypothetical protein [Streptosporangiaceae bacterium]
MNGSARARHVSGARTMIGAGPADDDWNLQGADLVSLRTAVTLRNLELDTLVFVEAPVTGGLNCRVVHKDVRTTAVDSDEAEALLSVEPLHYTLRHVLSLTRIRSPHLAVTGPAWVFRLPR